MIDTSSCISGDLIIGWLMPSRDGFNFFAHYCYDYPKTIVTVISVKNKTSNTTILTTVEIGDVLVYQDSLVHNVRNLISANITARTNER